MSPVHSGLVRDMFAHVRRTRGGDGGGSLLLLEEAEKIFFGGKGSLFDQVPKIAV